MLHRLVCVLLPLMLAHGLTLPDAFAAGRRPNFVVILADDMGFSDAGCYGGEIRTPNIDRLAAGGLRFTQFYNTARCWPTRAALLTGYYPQQIRMDPPSGRLPVWAKPLPHRLKPLGYRSHHSGKWHVQGAPAVLVDGGFDRSYRLEDHDRNFGPRRLFEDDRPLPATPTNGTYYTTTAIADHAIRCLREHEAEHAEQPFFAYVAFTSPHFPLHAPATDIARTARLYDDGWDTVRERRWRRLRDVGIVNCELGGREPDAIPHWNLPEAVLKERLGAGEVGRAVAWTTLNDEERSFQATKMAIHAAMVERMDAEIGRVLDQLKSMGAWENTVVMFASDNGASAEQIIRGDGHDRGAAPGSAGTFLCLGPGWSTAANSPFRRHKSWVHEGGIATPLVVHWPAGITERGTLRHDPGHVIDIAPTLMELAGVGRAGDPQANLEGPPLSGRSLVPAFAKDGAVQREFLFFHHDANRALRMGDWKLVSGRPETNRWALYDLSRDRGERVDMAPAEPERVKAMSTRWEELEREFRAQAAKGSE